MADDKRRTIRPDDDAEERLDAPDPSGTSEDGVEDEPVNGDTREPIDSEEYTIDDEDEAVDDDEFDAVDEEEDDAPSRAFGQGGPQPPAREERDHPQDSTRTTRRRTSNSRIERTSGSAPLPSLKITENVSRKEWELLKQQSKTEVILEILNVVDDFERAFSVAEDTDERVRSGYQVDL